MKTVMTLGMLVLFAAFAEAQDADIQSFGYGFYITGDVVVEGEPYRITLPAHVYENVAYSDLRDMAVYNTAGETVPFALFRPQAEQDGDAENSGTGGALVTGRPDRPFDRVEKIILSGAYDSPKRDRVNFTLPGYYPVEWIHLDPASSSLLSDFSVRVRNKKEDGWQTLFSRESLSVSPTMPGVTGIAAGGARYRQWQIEAPSPLPADGSGGVFYWRADELIFLARGQGPFILAYGSAAVKGSIDGGQAALLKLVPYAGRISEEFDPFMIAGNKAALKMMPVQNSGMVENTPVITALAAFVLIASAVAVRLVIRAKKKRKV